MGVARLGLDLTTVHTLHTMSPGCVVNYMVIYSVITSKRAFLDGSGTSVQLSHCLSASSEHAFFVVDTAAKLWLVPQYSTQPVNGTVDLYISSIAHRSSGAR